MVAIHEVMEQQTISICKGGVHAILNARASVLAACNSCNNCYDMSKSFDMNVKLSPPIISRFDLIFVLRDIKQNDAALAWHLIKLKSESKALGDQKLYKKQLWKYIKWAAETENN